MLRILQTTIIATEFELACIAERTKLITLIAMRVFSPTVPHG